MNSVVSAPPAQRGFGQRCEQQHAAHGGIVDHEFHECIHGCLGALPRGLGGRHRLHEGGLRLVAHRGVDRAHELVPVPERLVEVPFGQRGGAADRAHVHRGPVRGAEQRDARAE